ncbi:hypothetical protein [Christensenella intestinihominis]|uniref:hypothetical protein n=1 Tax=Christensenella intestinihominis TaxID=1851429 RepID=UPI000835EFBA|nr:hypothetical protein [Christensenella intestinihominis]
MERQGRGKKKSSRKAIIVLVIALIALGTVTGYFIWQNAAGGHSRFELDELARDGFFKDKSPEDIEALLNQVVSEGMFNISINSNPVFEDGKSEGNLRIENVPNNPYYMTVVITQDDTGEKIYQSKGLKQEQYIENAKLSVELPKGEYPCTAVFTAVDPDTLKEVGTAAAQITIHVLN